MSQPERTWSVFAKPWATRDADDLGALVAGMGFSGVELPVRPGCAVTPERAVVDLPRYADGLARHGVRITSVAGELTEHHLAACAAAGVPLLRIMPRLEGPFRDEVRTLRDRLAAAAPMVERYGVVVGLQHHHGPYVTTATGMREVVDPLPECYRVVWDAGHEGIAGQDLRRSLDAVRDRLALVNLKNAVRRPTTVTDDLGERQVFRHVWVDGPDGFADWAVALDQVVRVGWDGPICLCAEYTGEPERVADRTAADRDLADRLLAAAVRRSTSTTPEGAEGSSRP